MIGASLAAIALPAHARDSAEDIIVTAQKQNQTAVLRGGSVGVFGDKAAEDTPFSIKTYNEALILNQQPQTLGPVLETDPSVRTTLGFGIPGELFFLRGFALSCVDARFGGLYCLPPCPTVRPPLPQSVQVPQAHSSDNSRGG